METVIRRWDELAYSSSSKARVLRVMEIGIPQYFAGLNELYRAAELMCDYMSRVVKSYHKTEHGG